MNDAATTEIYTLSPHDALPICPRYARAARRAGLEALEIVDRAIELGFLPPAPAARACTWCDFRSVCGPDEARRIARKPVEPLGDLQALRAKP